MAARVPVDSLDAALTDLERLAGVLNGPRPPEANHAKGLNMLFKKELKNLKSSSVITPSNATLENIERLGELCEWFSYGGDTITTLSIFALVFEILTITTSKRAAYTDSHNLGAKGRSDLQILKDLEH